MVFPSSLVTTPFLKPIIHVWSLLFGAHGPYSATATQDPIVQVPWEGRCKTVQFELRCVWIKTKFTVSFLLWQQNKPAEHGTVSTWHPEGSCQSSPFGIKASFHAKSLVKASTSVMEKEIMGSDRWWKARIHLTRPHLHKDSCISFFLLSSSWCAFTLQLSLWQESQLEQRSMSWTIQMFAWSQLIQGSRTICRCHLKNVTRSGLPS